MRKTKKVEKLLIRKKAWIISWWTRRTNPILSLENVEKGRAIKA